MKIEGFAWLGVKTLKVNELASFFKRVLGLRVLREKADFVIFELPDGGYLELFGPKGPDLPAQFASSPVAGGFWVRDIEAAVSELKAAGVELVSPLERDPESGSSWQMFRGPDGLVYELVHDPARL